MVPTLTQGGAGVHPPVLPPGMFADFRLDLFSAILGMHEDKVALEAWRIVSRAAHSGARFHKEAVSGRITPRWNACQRERNNAAVEQCNNPPNRSDKSRAVRARPIH